MEGHEEVISMLRAERDALRAELGRHEDGAKWQADIILQLRAEREGAIAERDALKVDAEVGALVRMLPVGFLLRHSVNLGWSLETQITNDYFTHVLQSADDPHSALNYAGEADDVVRQLKARDNEVPA